MAQSMWKIPFGKFKDKEVETVPDYYLQWLIRQDWFCLQNKDKVEIINKELKYREDFDEHINGDD